MKKVHRLSWNTKVLFVSTDSNYKYWGWNNAGSLSCVLRARGCDPMSITLLCSQGYLKPSDTVRGSEEGETYWFLEKAFDKPTRKLIKEDKLTPEDLIKILKES